MTYRTHTTPDVEYRSDEWWRYYIDQFNHVQQHSASEGFEQVVGGQWV